jgi:hypothetical protein
MYKLYTFLNLYKQLHIFGVDNLGKEQQSSCAQINQNPLYMVEVYQ